MNTREKQLNNLLWLVESGLMLAVATVLSEFVTLDLPYGGSITIFGQVPILLVAYRHGFGKGLLTSFVFSGINLFFGREAFSYVKTFPTVLAVLLLDYLIAFSALSLGGVLRGELRLKRNTQALELCGGAILACFVRFVCHTLSGILVWSEYADADFFTFIPFLHRIATGLDGHALVIFYSVGYNAAYMLPETILCVIALFLLGRTVDLRKAVPQFGGVRS